MKTHIDGTLPTNGEIFVFGSNLSGYHGAGAAKVARQLFGAKLGTSLGMTGFSFAIPTKDERIQTIGLGRIKVYVDIFNDYAKQHPELEFWMSRIGCGLAGYDNIDIAPMFKPLPNINWPEEWVEFLL